MAFLHGGGAPSQGHRGRAPVFDVAANPTHRAHDILDDVRAGERAAQFAGEAEPRDSEHLVDPFQDRSGNAVPVSFETAREIANERLGLLGVIDFPGLPQDPPHRSVHRFGQPLHDVARLVNLAPLDRRIASKRAADRLGQRLRAIDDEQTSHSRIKSTLDEIVDERLHGRRIFVAPSTRPSGCLSPFASTPIAATRSISSSM
jgi:hypothetical protein